MSVALIAYWQYRSVRFSTSTAYRMLFPFLISGLLAIPFLGTDRIWMISGGIQAAFSCAAAILAITAARTSRDQGVNPIFVYGLCCGVAYLMRNLGAVAGPASVEFAGFGIGAGQFVAILNFYLLGAMLFLVRGGFSLKVRPLHETVDVELVTTAPAMSRPVPEAAVVDPLDVQCDQVRDCFHLSLRETEVLGLVVRGCSVPAMAERLFISENAVQTHMKHIYSKLAVHKKQDVLDIVESFPG